MPWTYMTPTWVGLTLLAWHGRGADSACNAAWCAGPVPQAAPRAGHFQKRHATTPTTTNAVRDFCNHRTEGVLLLLAGSSAALWGNRDAPVAAPERKGQQRGENQGVYYAGSRSGGQLLDLCCCGGGDAGPLDRGWGSSFPGGVSGQQARLCADNGRASRRFLPTRAACELV